MAYQKLKGVWTWEQYPPPYDFLAPKNPAVMAAPVLRAQPVSPVIVNSGFGGCNCGGSCCGSTIAQGGGAGVAGLGLFETTDFSEWGVGEWATIGVGLYLLFSLFGDAKRAKKSYTKSRSKARRRAQLQAQF